MSTLPVLYNISICCFFQFQLSPSAVVYLKWLACTPRPLNEQKKRGSAVICLSQAPEIYILTFIVCNNFAWRSRGISWLFFCDELWCYEEYAHKAPLSPTSCFFSLGGMVFPGEMQWEDKTAVQIPWVGLPRRHKRALDLGAGYYGLWIGIKRPF